MRNLEVVVVGAGIGGLQTALALASDGHTVTILESAKSFEEVRSAEYPSLRRIDKTCATPFLQLSQRQKRIAGGSTRRSVVPL